MPAGSVFVLLPLLGMVAVVVVALAVRETIVVVVVITISPALLYCVCVCVCLRLSHALVVAQRSYEEKIKQRRHTPSPQNPLFLIFFFENSPKKNESSFHLSVCDFTQI
jgi:hypothetical protein